MRFLTNTVLLGQSNCRIGADDSMLLFLPWRPTDSNTDLRLFTEKPWTDKKKNKNGNPKLSAKDAEPWACPLWLDPYAPSCYHPLL